MNRTISAAGLNLLEFPEMSHTLPFFKPYRHSTATRRGNRLFRP